jgi:hypothetical protein
MKRKRRGGEEWGEEKEKKKYGEGEEGEKAQEEKVSHN